MRVSHETIYRSLFIQARGVLKKGADSAPQVQAAYTSLTALAGCGTVSRSDRRCHLD